MIMGQWTQTTYVLEVEKGPEGLASVREFTAVLVLRAVGARTVHLTLLTSMATPNQQR